MTKTLMNHKKKPDLSDISFQNRSTLKKHASLQAGGVLLWDIQAGFILALSKLYMEQMFPKTSGGVSGSAKD